MGSKRRIVMAIIRQAFAQNIPHFVIIVARGERVQIPKEEVDVILDNLIKENLVEEFVDEGGVSWYRPLYKD